MLEQIVIIPLSVAESVFALPESAWKLIGCNPDTSMTVVAKYVVQSAIGKALQSYEL